MVSSTIQFCHVRHSRCAAVLYFRSILPAHRSAFAPCPGREERVRCDGRLYFHHLVPLTRSSTALVPCVPDHGIEPQLSTHVVAALASPLLAGPLEVTDLHIGPVHSASSAIDACLVIPSARRLILSHVPPRLHADRPLEVGLDSVGLGAGARCIRGALDLC